MTSVQIRTLNAYPELKTNAGIQQVIDYIQFMENPLHAPVAVFFAALVPPLTQRQIQRFEVKFNPIKWRVRQFWIAAVNNFVPYLSYEPSDRIRLQVISPENAAEQQQRLRQIYANDREGLGKGINAFYNFVCTKYLGIKRETCTDFLKKQGDYQLTRPYHKTVNHPILAKSPNERWEIDIMFLNSYIHGAVPAIPDNHHFNHIMRNGVMRLCPYVMVVVDCFSKKMWARPLTDRTALQTRNALIDICIHDCNITYPRIIQNDNGAEWTGQFAQWISHGLHPVITQITIKPYSPTSDGLVERMNQILRNKIKEGFVRHNTLEWVVHLQNYCANINNSKQSRTKYTPNELWTRGRHPIPLNQAVNFDIVKTDTNTLNEIRHAVQARSILTAQAQISRNARGKAPAVFAVGNRVRIALRVQHAEVRKRMESGIQAKLTAVKYTPQVYTVISVVGIPAENYQLPAAVGQQWNVVRQRYTLQDYLGNEVMERGNPKLFFGSELKLVPQPTQAPHVQSIPRARQINRFVAYP